MTAEWMDAALCRGLGDAMQPEVASVERVEEAKALCGGCPVRAECEDLAAGQPNAYGVHAGQWYGDDPRRPGAVICEWCGGPVVDGLRSTGKFCGMRCRVAAHRARRSLSA